MTKKNILTPPRYNQRAFKGLWNLNRADEAAVRVPKPIIAKNNILIMEFIGDSDGTPARLMRQSQISNPQYVVDKIIDYIKKLYNDAELVHGDLSGFNILMEDDEPVYK